MSRKLSDLLRISFVVVKRKLRRMSNVGSHEWMKAAGIDPAAFLFAKLCS